MDWILQIGSVFDYKRNRDPKFVLLTETRLREGAMHSWRNFQQNHTRVGLLNVTNWAEMKAELEKRYNPVHLCERIAALRQGSLSVADYSDEFRTLINKDDLNEPELITVGRY